MRQQQIKILYILLMCGRVMPYLNLVNCIPYLILFDSGHFWLNSFFVFLFFVTQFHLFLMFSKSLVLQTNSQILKV